MPFSSVRCLSLPNSAVVYIYISLVLYIAGVTLTVCLSVYLTEAEMIDSVYPDVLPTPDRLHHIVEDFLTEFDAPISHILPTRR